MTRLNFFRMKYPNRRKGTVEIFYLILNRLGRVCLDYPKPGIWILDTDFRQKSDF